VDDAVRGSGTGIAGSVVQILKSATVIEPCGVTVAGKFYADKVISRREGRNAAYIGVYKLVSESIAREFLRRHGRPVSIKQEELSLA